MHETSPMSGGPPAEPVAAPTAPLPSTRTRVMAGSRRTIASLLLAVGLMAIGGVAAVNAASPAPSPGASGAPSGGSGGAGTHTGNCPGM
jgi:hypothetical protein